MDPAELKREFGRDITFHGCISAQKVLPLETPEQVREHVRAVCRVMRPGGLLALAMEGSKEAPNQQKQTALAARMEFPLYSGAEMEEMLAAAGFSRAWFESAPDKGWGWLCALGVK